MANSNYDVDAFLMHHGIKGMKWGKRNGPPYPLKPEAHSASEKKAGWRSSLNKGGRKPAGSSGEGSNEKLKKAALIGAGVVGAAAITYAAYKVTHDPEVADLVKMVAREAKTSMKRKPIDIEAIRKASSDERTLLRAMSGTQKDVLESQSLLRDIQGELIGVAEPSPLQQKRLAAAEALYKRDSALHNALSVQATDAHTKVMDLRYSKQGGWAKALGVKSEAGQRAKDLVTSRLAPRKATRLAAAQRMMDADQARINAEIARQTVLEEAEAASKTDRNALLAAYHQLTGQVAVTEGSLTEAMKRSVSAA